MRIGEVASVELPGGGYGAIQITALNEDLVTVVALGFYSAGPPALDDIGDAPVLIADHFSHRGRPASLNIDRFEPVPPSLTWLGVQPAREPSSSNSFSGWSWAATTIRYHRRWHHELPEAARLAYKTAPREEMLVAGKTIHAWSGGANLTDVADRGSFDWSGLDSLPRVTELMWRGPDLGLVEALRQRPMISDLHWHEPPSDVDLGGTCLTEVAFYGGGLETLTLPESVYDLRLGCTPQVTAHRGGHWIALTCEGTAPPALPGVRDLRWEVDGEADAARLAALPALEELTIKWRRPPGTLAHPEALAHLKILTLIDGYGIRPDEIPEIPAIEVNGTRRSIASAFGKAFGRRARVRGAKNDTWIEANFENPLRDWVDDGDKFGEAAAKAYAKALRAGSAEGLEAFVKELNRLERKYELIDTMRRDQAWEAFQALARRAGIDADQAAEWFGDWRDF